MVLKRGSTGPEVRELQRLLNEAGILSKNGMPLPLTTTFGAYTEYSVRKFQEREHLEVDGIAGPQTMARLKELTNSGGYSKMRLYGSDIHVYQVRKSEVMDVERGVLNKLERLSQITKAGKTVVAKTNAGFFDMNGKGNEHYGTYIDEGKVYKGPSKDFIDMIYYKDGHTEIRYLDPSELNALAPKVNWAIGTSWSLIVNGQVNIQCCQGLKSLAASKGPRTLIGQKKDGSLIVVVVQGRRIGQAGITAAQSAELMKTLGCYNAANLDGGGSAEMIVNGKIVNVPTDGTERLIGSAIIIYKE